MYFRPVSEDAGFFAAEAGTEPMAADSLRPLLAGDTGLVEPGAAAVFCVVSPLNIHGGVGRFSDQSPNPAEEA